MVPPVQSIVIDIADPVSPDQPAIDAALACRTEGTPVALFHNVYHKSIIDQQEGEDQVLGEVRELLLESRKRQLQTLAKDRLGDDVSVNIVWAEQGWQELIRYSARSDAQLVVSQTNYRNRWQRMTLSNNDWETIRHCPIPLLLARAGVQQRYQQVLAAIDPLHLDDKPASLDQDIVDLANTIASHHQAQLQVVNVVVPTQMAPMGGMQSAMFVSDVAEKVIDAHREAAEKLVSRCGPGDARVHVKVGSPEEEIVELANACEGTLVVMGGISRSRLQRLLIGSTAERVLDQLVGDVMIIKPRGFGSNLPAVNALLQASI